MSDGNIIGLEGKYGERERVKLAYDQEKSFSEIMRDFDEEVMALASKFAYGWDEQSCYESWVEWNNLPNKQKAKALLDQAAKVHEIAQKLLSAAIREEKAKAS